MTGFWCTYCIQICEITGNNNCLVNQTKATPLQRDKQLPWQRVKKLVSVSAIFVFITEVSKKAESKDLKRSEFQRVISIYYPTLFDKLPIKMLIDSNSKVNEMKPSFAKILGLYSCIINVGVQKIDGNKVETFKIVIALFLVDDKDKKSRCFEKTSLFADVSMDVFAKMFLLTLNNVEILFNN